MNFFNAVAKLAEEEGHPPVRALNTNISLVFSVFYCFISSRPKIVTSNIYLAKL